MPYPKEHSCRLEDPDKYDKFARKNCAEKHDGKCIDFIFGIKKGKSELQAMRYDKEIWTEEAARKHCKDHDGTFEAAKEDKTMEKGREERAYKVEMRVEDGDEPKITGHAAVFSKLSVDLMGFREKVAPGAFAGSIEKSDIRALWNHNPDYVLGRNKSGTLHLEEDKKGLAIEISPPDTQWARDLMETIKRGDVDQMSFAFQVVKDSWDESGKEKIRTLEEVELFDVSPVTYPAYPQTDVKVRSVLEEAGLDVNRLAVVMERRTATNNEDIAVVKQAIDVLNSYLPRQAEDSDGQGTPNEGYVERLKKKCELWEFSKEINKEVKNGKIS